MTDEMMSFRALLEKAPGADFPREMIGFAAERLMELEVGAKTGVKMGAQRPVTFGPDEMGRLRDIVLEGKFRYADGGAYRFIEDFPARYIADLVNRPKISRKLKAAAACGNGTAGAFAPNILTKLGCEVVPLDTGLDYTFPNYNPNPEDLHMLHAMAAKVLETGADAGLGFDGDRCGVVNNRGAEIFADKIGGTLMDLWMIRFAR